ncbi:MAG TPA: hypothetical protein VD794_02105 [Flavisolibacter sp.]|nr:hypothetical protein [Flavisolibacter sp.]
MYTHLTTYTIGDTVYLRTDQEQRPRIVVAITLRPGNACYELGCGPDSSFHFDIEMTAEADESLRLGLDVNKEK